MEPYDSSGQPPVNSVRRIFDQCMRCVHRQESEWHDNPGQPKEDKILYVHWRLKPNHNRLGYKEANNQIGQQNNDKHKTPYFKYAFMISAWTSFTNSSHLVMSTVLR